VTAAGKTHQSLACRVAVALIHDAARDLPRVVTSIAGLGLMERMLQIAAEPLGADLARLEPGTTVEL